MPNQSNTGRKRDIIWAEFDEISGNRAKCRKCDYSCAALVARMKRHYSEKHTEHAAAVKTEFEQGTQPKQMKMSSFTVSTLDAEIARFDRAIGKFVFSSNIPFANVEKMHFIVSTFLSSKN